MGTAPALIPLPPTAGSAITISTSPFWIGAARDCALQLHLPGIAPHHAAILEREDGFWLARGTGASPPPTVNDTTATADVRLSHGDLVELAPAARYRFDTGESAAREDVDDEPTEPVFAPIPATRRRRRRGLTKAQRRTLRFTILAAIAAAIVLGLVTAAVVLALRAF